MHFGFLFLVKSDGENTVKHLQNSARVWEQIQTILFLGAVCGGLACGYYFLGDLENARKHAERAIQIDAAAGITLLLSLPHIALCMIHLDSGDLKTARSHAEQALNLALKNGEKQLESRARMLLGRLMAKEDISQSAKAREHIGEAIKALEERKVLPYSSVGYLYLGELYADMGQREKALEILKKAESAFRKMGMEYHLLRTQKLLERLQS